VLLFFLSLLSGCGETEDKYYVSMTVKVDGQLRTATALQKVVYFSTGDANGKPTTNSRSGGVAPIIDLGPDGTLVAALSGDLREWQQRSSEYNLTCHKPRRLNEVIRDTGRRYAPPDAPPIKIWDDYLPAFIWFPHAKSYKAGIQLCPEEFSRVIGRPIELVSVSYQNAPGKTIPTKLELSAPWLDEMRAEKFGELRSSTPDKPLRYLPSIHQIEGEGWR
jgi:hypothetical protein